MLFEDTKDFENKVRLFLEKDFQLNPKKIDYFLSAFTHSSFKPNTSIADYERLELLGDSFIALIITHLLYTSQNTLKDMCSLRKQIIQSQSLSYISKKISLDKYLRIGSSCKSITNSMLEDVYESFIGAVFLSFGYETAKNVVIRTLWNSYVNKELCFSLDYKTTLQELTQKFSLIPKYELVDSYKLENGSKRFVVNVIVGKEVLGSGEGSKLKEAEQLAAKQAISKFIK